jgi:hypothetical protein
MSKGTYTWTLEKKTPIASVVVDPDHQLPDDNAATMSEIRPCLRQLLDTTGTGFIHESFEKDDPKQFTRPWFAWANTLFGELICRLAETRPAILRTALG